MALLLARGTFAKLTGLPVLLGRQALPLSASKTAALAPIQVATMRATYGEKYPYAKPWPYEKKNFNLLYEMLVDSSIEKYCENSKVITIEGNLAVGKTDFAERLARNFDLKVIHGTTDDDAFIQPSGFDMRSVDDILPEGARSYDLEKFFADTNPQCGTIGRLQWMMYRRRFMDYARGLLHLFSTGQGVVLVRSAYSDMVFVEAMRKMGYVSKNFVPYYYDIQENSICELLPPHLTIYLDASIATIKDRIKKRNDPREVNSTVTLNDKYLEAIDWAYKQKFLPKMRKSGAVMEIDWNEVGDDMDLDVISDEIEEMRLESEDNEDHHFCEWNHMNDDKLAHLRKIYCSGTHLDSHFHRPLPWSCPELLMDDDCMKARQKILIDHPAMKYEPGWIPEMGDKVAFKLY